MFKLINVYHRRRLVRPANLGTWICDSASGPTARRDLEKHWNPIKWRPL